LIAHLVWAKEPPKVNKSKIRVTRKPDLPGPKKVYHFASFIEPYRTHCSDAFNFFFNLLDCESGQIRQITSGDQLKTNKSAEILISFISILGLKNTSNNNVRFKSNQLKNDDTIKLDQELSYIQKYLNCVNSPNNFI
jgi:hypothetical protein